MAKDFEKDAAVGISRAQAAAEQAVDEAGRKVKGEARSFAGKADATADGTKDALGRAADQARSAVSSAADTYADLRRRAMAVSETVDPFVRESPYAAMAVSVLVGVVLGMLLFGGGAKVVYVKPLRG